VIINALLATLIVAGGCQVVIIGGKPVTVCDLPAPPGPCRYVKVCENGDCRIVEVCGGGD
jgi:hypothetical protein